MNRNEDDEPKARNAGGFSTLRQTGAGEVLDAGLAGMMRFSSAPGPDSKKFFAELFCKGYYHLDIVPPTGSAVKRGIEGEVS